MNSTSADTPMSFGSSREPNQGFGCFVEGKLIRNCTPAKNLKESSSPEQEEAPKGHSPISHSGSAHIIAPANLMKASCRPKIICGPGKRINKRVVHRRQVNEFQEEDEDNTTSRLKLLIGLI